MWKISNIYAVARWSSSISQLRPRDRRNIYVPLASPCSIHEIKLPRLLSLSHMHLIFSTIFTFSLDLENLKILLIIIFAFNLRTRKFLLSVFLFFFINKWHHSTKCITKTKWNFLEVELDVIPKKLRIWFW